MTVANTIIRAGTLLIIETGVYSDRDWSGPVRVLKDIDREEVARSFRLENNSPRGPEASDFLPWLVASDYVEDAENIVAWHVGGYYFMDGEGWSARA